MSDAEPTVPAPAPLQGYCSDCRLVFDNAGGPPHGPHCPQCDAEAYYVDHCDGCQAPIGFRPDDPYVHNRGLRCVQCMPGLPGSVGSS